MASNTREIRRRIKSIQNTKKITKAMELVAASKMRRATQGVTATRPYAAAAWDVLTHVSDSTDPELHPLLVKREVKRVCLIVFTSDRGLAGGLNGNVVRRSVEFIREQRGVNVDVIAVGKKGAEGLRRSGANIVSLFTKLTERPALRDLRPVFRLAIEDYIAKKYDRVVMIYPDFISTLTQRPRARQLLPVTREEIGRFLTQVGVEEKAMKQNNVSYKFEPSPDAVLEQMLSGLVRLQLFQALLETTASEHASRMVAMRNATEAAEDFISDLTLSYNQVRQSVITRDLAEISAGRAALEG